MNSVPVLREERQDTTSTLIDKAPRRKVPYISLERFQDAVTTPMEIFTFDTGLYGITAPQIGISFIEREIHDSVANPIIGPIEFEFNPIVQIYPAIGKHFPMKVVGRSKASIKLSTRNIIDQDL